MGVAKHHISCVISFGHEISAAYNLQRTCGLHGVIAIYLYNMQNFTRILIGSYV